MNKTWQRVKLGEVAEIKTGKGNVQDSVNDGIYPFFDRSQKIKKSHKFIFDSEAVIVAGEGKDFIPRYYKGKFDLHQRCYAIFNITQNAKYIYYAIYNKKDVFKSIAVGSTVMSLRLNHFTDFIISLPPLETQQRIAEILSSLDDKIDLLHRQNKTLESLALTLFRHTFIENPNHNEWQIGKLGDWIEIKSGKPLKREFFIKNGAYEILGANGIIGRTNQFLCDERLIYTGRVGTLGKIFLINSPQKVWLSDNTLIVKPKKYFYFIYFLLKELKLENFNVGSTQPLIRQSDIANIEILMPDSNLILMFENKCINIFNKISHNMKEIQNLESLRDIMLPKLLSGEVEV